MPQPLRVLIAEDRPTDAELVVRELRRAGFAPEWQRVDTETEYAASLRPELDIILSDYAMPEFSALRALEVLRQSGLEIPLIIISGTIGEDTAVAAMKEGAVDYLLKDRLARLGSAVEQAVEKGRLRRERALAQLALRESEERFREVVQNIEEVFWMTNLEKTEMLFVSAAYEKIWGRACASLYASPMTWLEAIHPADRGRVLDSAKTKQIDGTYHEEYRIVRPDGSIRWINDRAFPIRDADGAVRRVAGVARDITERKQAETALRLFRALVDQSAATFEVIDPVTGRFLDVNGKGPAELGCTREEYLSLRVSDIDPMIAESAWPPLAEKIRVTGDVIGEGCHRRKDGTTFPIEFNAKWVRLDRDYIVTIVRDISARKRAEEVLRESSLQKVGQQKTRMKRDLAVIGAVCVLLFGCLYFLDPIQAPVRSFASRHLDNLDDFVEALAVVLAGVAVFFYRRWREFQDQARQEAQVRAALRTLHDEVEMRVQQRTVELSKSNEALRTEIVERRQADERVREQAAMLDHAHEAIMVCDIETHRITYWNEGAERLYGWTAAEAVGRDLRELLYPDPDAQDPITGELLRAGEWQGESRQVTKAGKKLAISGHATLVRDAAGAPKSALVINIDITEQKALEARFLRAQRMESIGTLASGVAHDLNNILSPIMMAVPLLRRDLPPEVREDIVSTIELSAERGAQIVKQVLTFGRGLEGERSPMQVAAVIKEIVKMLGETIPKDIHIDTDLPSDLRLVIGDATQLQQVMLNLCVNARDAMPTGGTLRLRARNVELEAGSASSLPGATLGPNVLLEVEDTGSGIAPEIIERIFDPFFTTKAIGKGTGLGLSTVIGIVKSHGGHIGVKSETGAGTTFQIHLPAQAQSGPSAPATPVAVGPPRGQGEWVLVVDDEEQVRRTVQLTLEAHGYRVLTATDGTDALASFAQNADKIAVVLTDLMMPHMNGVALIHALRKMKPNLPVIASTGLGQKRHLLELERMNIQDMLQKPYGRETLLNCVHTALSGASFTPP